MERRAGTQVEEPHKDREHDARRPRESQGGLEWQAASLLGKEEHELQASAEEARALVRDFSAILGSMEGCYKVMQQRFVAYLQTTELQQQWMAATIYSMMRQVSAAIPSLMSVFCGHGSILDQIYLQGVGSGHLHSSYLTVVAVPYQALSGSPTAELSPASPRSSNAPAPRAAPDSCVLPTPQHTPTADIGSAGRSVNHAAVLSQQPHEGVGGRGERKAAGVSGTAGISGSGSGYVHPAQGLTGREAAEATAVEIVRLWPGLMCEIQPPETACTGAAAEQLAAAAERASTARMQTYPLPPRVTPKYIRLTASEAYRSLHAADTAQPGILQSVVAEMESLMDRCAEIAQRGACTGPVLGVWDARGGRLWRDGCSGLVEAGCGGLCGHAQHTDATGGHRPEHDRMV